MQLLLISGRDNFLKKYLIPAMEQGFVAMKYPQSPKHPKQRYLLTGKGQVTGQPTGQVSEKEGKLW